MKKLLPTIILTLSFTAVQAKEPATKVIAHRGYWNTEGSAQNSVAALKKAAEIGVYGSEFDVHVPSDGIPLLNHGVTINGLKI